MPRLNPASLHASVLTREEAMIAEAVEKLRAGLSRDGQEAGRCVAGLIEQGGALVFPALRAWTADPDPQIRKTLAQGVAQAADPGNPFRATFLFALIEPLLWDQDPSVRAQARRVLREELIPTYPEEALEVLAQWAAEPNPQKQAFAAEGLVRLPPSLAKRALIPLRNLGRSGDPKVRGAVVRALRRWRTRAPEAVEMELTRWANDPVLSSLIQRIRA